MGKTKQKIQRKDERNLETPTSTVPAIENYFFKNVFSLIMVLTMPNFVMVLDFVVKKCNSSFIEFYDHLQRKSFYEVFQDIWLKDEFDFLFGISIITIYAIFALFLMIVIPGKIVKGSPTPKGNVPLYKDNGFFCYIVSLIALCLSSYYLTNWSSFSISIIYKKFPSILACLSIFSLVICLLLYIKGILFPTYPDNIKSGYFFFDYYWGIELHPRIKGVDIKVFTNCRFGMTIWALLLVCFVKYGIENGTLRGGLLVSVVLQLLYITKFFWWEAGYYNTTDMNVDHAGFYICWGCLVFLPSFFTLSTYHMVTHPSTLSNLYYISVFLTGLFSLILNYWADYQKQIVRLRNGKCLIWTKPAKYIEAEYVDLNGKKKKSILLTCGFWGLARHFHYFPELMLAFSWCAASGFDYLIPFSYFIYLLILLLHRFERDDQKCRLKYGKYYEEYKKIVPWKIVPYIY